MEALRAQNSQLAWAITIPEESAALPLWLSFSEVSPSDLVLLRFGLGRQIDIQAHFTLVAVFGIFVFTLTLQDFCVVMRRVKARQEPGIELDQFI